ncbi:hypothetical protein MNKW57_10770 [Biformimicrobium ophioploci]|uniref:GP-PDE domain-containing protein n=2 Tax=Biformimicrobium ophioploci TaxID=3036711 RepID=A0ABQ6LXC4_9GAMM|nr:hypothetical protein MNKW57_10770 [Microbulbifer sp. NKW57]
MAAALAHDFRVSWQQLLKTHLLYELIAAILLVPVGALLLNLVLWLLGNPALTDEDILLFALNPLGAVVLVAVITLGVAIFSLRNLALIWIGYRAAHNHRSNYILALTFVNHHFWGVVRYVGVVVFRVGLRVVPYLLLCAATVYLLLDQYDINYYLSERPPEFWWALGLIVLFTVVLLWKLWGLLISWIFALPLVTFRGKKPAAALAHSETLTRGYRIEITAFLLAWLAFAVLVYLLSYGLFGVLVHWGTSVFFLSGSESWTASAALVLLMILGALINWSASFVVTASYCLLIARLYMQFRIRHYGQPKAINTKPATNFTRVLLSRIFPRRRFTGIHIFAGLLVALGFASAISAELFGNLKPEDRVGIIAHRGASYDAPENTLAAIELALQQGADTIEIDVQQTLSGEILVIHDRDLKKVSGADTQVRDLTADDLARFDVGAWKGISYAGERIPTLQQVLDAVKGRAQLFVELKYYGHEQGFEQGVLALLDGTGMQDSAHIISLNPRGLAAVRALDDGYQLGLLTSVKLGRMLDMDVDFFLVNRVMATRGLVKAAQKRGKRLVVWTINDDVEMSAMISRGVDGIITDRPDLARHVLDRRRELTLAQRALVGFAEVFDRSIDLPEWLEAD